MYYEWPEAEESYVHPGQYMFGDDMIIAPVASPSIDGYSKIKVWLPEGNWIEEATRRDASGRKDIRTGYGNG